MRGDSETLLGFFLQMRLYTMHKGQHLLIFIMFLSLFFIALLMGMAGPSIITTYEESAAKLVRDANNASVGGEKVKSQIPAGPFLMVTPGLETYRQQVRMMSMARGGTMAIRISTGNG